MKKLIALLLALALASTLTPSALAESGQTEAKPEDTPIVIVMGTLSMLNMTEEEYAALAEARKISGKLMFKEGYINGSIERPEGAPDGPPTVVIENKIVFYDTLDALLMALNAGDIDNIEIYQSVARSLCAANDNLWMSVIYDTDKEQSTFAKFILNSINGSDFAFLMMENNAALRDEFNTAIADMKADGTLERLVKEQIDRLIDGGEILPIALPKIDGAEPVKVAVTGALPPMDYVAADGKPAGFNTAVLAEIGSRIGKNIEIVVVDSLGRAAALASGTVDAVFWTHTSSLALEAGAATEAEREAKEAGMTEEEIALLNELYKYMNPSTYSMADMPKGTIVTEPYFSDVLVPVMLAR